MMPVNFEAANIELEVPDLVNPEMYTGYKGLHFKNNLDADCVMTMWQPNKEDIEAINNGAPICLLQICEGMNLNRVHLYTTDGRVQEF